ncbi:hypothetical protein I2I11_13885 [Pontibacter sp. 172403-2]|uniref:hypothetical protein n=1 Tax=Pontibacter rufus TaxID=2791028 RepID=UPI0018B00B58|nr:hypothetical protein [Pontibacter sp. 172403-2]MBF9254391.1 hypothetical protein [Pontibacter sp. 172403-2]
MNKSLIYLSMWLTLMSCATSLKVVEEPTDETVLVSNQRYRGVIFKEKADCFLCRFGENRFTPSIEDILAAEEILRLNIKEENKPLVNQGEDCPIIHRNLDNYRRQYFGFINEAGERVIYINLSWDKYTIFDRLKGYEKQDDVSWKHQREMVLDGCSNHWEIKVNLTAKELFDLHINGSA